MRNRLPVKIGIVALIVVLGLTVIGSASAKWADTVAVESEITTGRIEGGFVPDSLVVTDSSGAGSLRSSVTQDTLQLELKNVCDYYKKFQVTWRNTGTLPMKIEHPVVTWDQWPLPYAPTPYPPDSHVAVPTGVALTLLQYHCNNRVMQLTWRTKSGLQVDPGEDLVMEFEVQMLQESIPGYEYYDFSLSIDAVPWNQYDGDGLVLPEGIVGATLEGKGDGCYGSYDNGSVDLFIGELDLRMRQGWVIYSDLRGWSTDLSHWIYVDQTWEATLESSLDQSSEAWNKINYIINHHEAVLAAYSGYENEESAAVQLAIWSYRPGVALEAFDVSPPALEMAQLLINAADASGADFVPSGEACLAALRLLPEDLSDCGPQELIVEWDP